MPLLINTYSQRIFFLSF